MPIAGHGDQEVLEAENGKEALELIKSSAPNLILCDWNIPEMNGLELSQVLNAAGIKSNFGFVTSEGTSFKAATNS
jgi:two-component system chemotaxis response regulator CheY